MIKAVFFDMGGTLEDLYSDEKNDKSTARELMRILNSHGITTPFGDDADGLWQTVKKPLMAYKKESEKTFIELKPEVLWPDYAFKDVPVDREKLIACSEEIAAMWEVTYYDRKLRPHVKEMLQGLKEDLGLYLGVISNTASLYCVYDVLKEYGIREYMDGINLSCITGYRKPSLALFRIALENANLKAEECAFVGDTLSRDVVGPRAAGFGEVFKINSFLTKQKDIGHFDVAPDHEVEDIYEVYTILKKELGK